MNLYKIPDHFLVGANPAFRRNRSEHKLGVRDSDRDMSRLSAAIRRAQPLGVHRGWPIFDREIPEVLLNTANLARWAVIQRD
jgi:hypothetical protein